MSGYPDSEVPKPTVAPVIRSVVACSEILEKYMAVTAEYDDMYAEYSPDLRRGYEHIPGFPALIIDEVILRMESFNFSTVDRMEYIESDAKARFMVTERVDGCLSRSSESMGLIKAFKIGIMAMGMVEKLHSQGVIHGDIHLGNMCFRLGHNDEEWTLIDRYIVRRVARKHDHNNRSTEEHFHGALVYFCPGFACPQYFPGMSLAVLFAVSLHAAIASTIAPVLSQPFMYEYTAEQLDDLGPLMGRMAQDQLEWDRVNFGLAPNIQGVLKRS